MKTLKDFEKFNKDNPIARLIKVFDEEFFLIENTSNYWYEQAEFCENKNFEVVEKSPIRKEVLEFAQDMERKLEENDHKSHWSLATVEYLFSRLQSEVIELEECIKKDNKEDLIIKECTDIANFAMMIADKCRI